MNFKSKVFSLLLVVCMMFAMSSGCFKVSANGRTEEEVIANFKAEQESGFSSTKTEEGMKSLEELLCDASYLNMHDIVKALVELGVDVNVRRVYSGCARPLTLAVFYNDMELFELMLSHGGDANLGVGCQFGTPLFAAVQIDDFELVNHLILMGVNINAEDDFGYTPLCYAIMEDNTELVKLLLDKGANTNVAGEFAITPLRLTLMRNAEYVDILINYGADVNYICCGGTILHNIVAEPNSESDADLRAIEILLEKGIDTFIKDDQDRTALDIAIEKHRYFDRTRTIELLSRSTMIENSII